MTNMLQKKAKQDCMLSTDSFSLILSLSSHIYVENHKYYFHYLSLHKYII